MLSFLCHRLSAGTLAYWLWLNYSFEPQDCCLAMWSMSMMVWELTGQVLGTARWRESENDPRFLSANFFFISRNATLALHQHDGSWPSSSIAFPFFLFFSSPATFHNKTFSTCSDARWWIELYHCSNIVVCHDDACFGGIDHLKPLRLRQFMPTALTVAYIQRSSLHRKSSWQGETVIVFEMKLWLCWFLFIYSHFWQPIC